MQVAASPFSSSQSHYHSYYQFHPPGPHDHELKRQYLSLLPPKQIIEICLTFDAYVPPYAKTTIWPLDLNAAIAGLQKIAPSSPSESSNSATHPQVAYPHAPYYTSSYPYPYSYPPPVQNGLQSSLLSSTPFPPHPTPYGAIVPPHPPEASGNDDLPSYEEMIVEALSECTDSEGWMPKDLFAWMAARYPLQSNFRPSASQALQKAFKRGRFEKGTTGKYRLSSSWEGGSTSRRTTRRPQTQTHASSGSTSRISAPPFTHAPLVHHHQPHMVTSHSPGQQPYPISPYGYSGYSGYVHHQPPASTSNASGAEPSSSTERTTAATGDSTAAYEAAQSILKAINFGGLLKLSPDEDEQKIEQASQLPHPVGNGVEHLLSHVQAILASRNSEDAAASFPAMVAEAMPSVLSNPSVQAPENQRAELQAQLALLSVQLAGLAQLEEPQVGDQTVSASSLHGPPMHSLTPDEPSLQSLGTTDVLSTTEVSSTADQPPSSQPLGVLAESEEESDEDDMEAVI